jgi:hypothetical protein
MERKLGKATALLEQLKSLPEEESVAILRSLRTGVQSSGAKEQARLLGTRPSSNMTARAILPNSPFDVNLELTARHHNIYPSLTPINTDTMELPDIISGICSDILNPARNEQPAKEDSSSTSETNQVVSPSERLSVAKSKSHMVPSIDLDDRLRGLNIQYWTSVPISNFFAMCAISMYLQVDHPFLGYFDADLFIRDLVEKRRDYCSEFLVAGLLYYACVCFARSRMTGANH